MIDLSKLKQQVSETQRKSNVDISEARKNWKVPTLKEKDSLVFSLVLKHKHQVEDGSPFVPLISYRLNSKESQYGTQEVYPESSFDETKIDPIEGFLELQKRTAREENDGDDNIPKELWKSLQKHVYRWVPVISTEFPSEYPVKWLRLSTTAFEDLVNQIADWYDPETESLPDFKLTRSSKQSYSISVPNSKETCMEKVDSKLLEDALENLPALDEGIVYVTKDEDKIQKMLKENYEIVMDSIQDEGELDYGSDTPKQTARQDTRSESDNNKLNSFFDGGDD